MRLNFRNSLYLTTAGLIAAVLLVFDWIRVSIGLEDPVLNGFHSLFTVVAFALLYAAVRLFRNKKSAKPLEILRKLVAYGFFATALISTWGIFLSQKGEGTDKYVPANIMQLLATTVFAFAIAFFVIILLTTVSDIIYIKPERKVRRRFELFVGFAILASFLSIFGRSGIMGTLRDIAFGIAAFIAVLHIVSMNWIVFLSRKDKYKSLVHTLVLMALFGYSFASTGPTDAAGGVLNFYSPPMAELAQIVFLFLAIYFSFAFVVTIFHIPTSGVFEKKKRELDSYQNLSKVITNVMDTSEVLNNTVAVVGAVTQANKVWIELRYEGDAPGEEEYKVSATHRTSQYELSAFNFNDVRNSVRKDKRVIIQDTDEFQQFNLRGFPARSLLAVPLIAHDDFIGMLYAAHEMPYAFDDEEISTVSAFADTAAVAIQNSLLFTKSLENERLQHELRIAHEMQLKLLPTSLPGSDKFVTDFLSFPAFEVGGDYIDYSRIDDTKFAFVVGDVSGKGTSAAFYMAYIKGVFQSLSASAKSPLEFMMAANEAVQSTLQKNFFITLIYATLDGATGEVSVVRAGHTPAVLVSPSDADGRRCRLIRPAGAGLGLEQSDDFGRHLCEEKFVLDHDDMLVFYTDGVTDQRNPSGEEFGEERFYGLLKELGGGTPTEVKGGIIRALAEFSQGTDAVDDTTVLVLKWR